MNGITPVYVRGKIVGEAIIIKVIDQSQQNITITKVKQNYGLLFTAYLQSPNSAVELGYAYIHHLRVMEHGRYGSENLSISSSDEIHHFCRYGNETEAAKADRIFVNLIKTKKNITMYKGIGTSLIQTAIEYGLRKKCEGRLQLIACWSSHCFHYKMGLRSRFKEDNQAITEKLEGAQQMVTKPDTHDLGPIVMYLPSAEIPKWLKKIKENPILYKTKLE